MTAEVEVLVLRERVRGLELAVELLRERAEPAAPGLGFRVVSQAALATAESDDGQNSDIVPTDTPKITWFGKPTVVATEPVNIIISEA